MPPSCEAPPLQPVPRFVAGPPWSQIVYWCQSEFYYVLVLERRLGLRDVILYAPLPCHEGKSITALAMEQHEGLFENLVFSYALNVDTLMAFLWTPEGEEDVFHRVFFSSERLLSGHDARYQGRERVSRDEVQEALNFRLPAWQELIGALRE